MNVEQLCNAAAMSPNQALLWLPAFAEAFEQFEISTVERQAAFIGQCAHESGNFKAMKENLNYSAEGLCKTWPKRFPSLEDAKPYHRMPEKIANKVYSSRMGNGDEQSGDGARYCGRGLIQLTGKDNYIKAGAALGVDLVNNPAWVEQPKYAALTAAWFWKTNGLNELADAKNNQAITRKINGGEHGLDDRIAKTERAMDVLNA